MNNNIPVDKDKITIKWLIDHLPISWWIPILSAIIAIFMAGLSVGGREPIVEWLQRNFNQEYNDQIESLKSKNSLIKSQNKEIEKLNVIKEKYGNSLKEIAYINNKYEKLNEEYNKKLRIENKLERDIGNLKTELKKIKDECGEYKSSNRTISTLPSATVQNLKASISKMYSSHVADFLIENTPKIQGGIPCHDFAELLNQGYSSHGSRVVKKVAPYIQRPIEPSCIDKIGMAIYSSEAAEAINILINSAPAY